MGKTQSTGIRGQPTQQPRFLKDSICLAFSFNPHVHTWVLCPFSRVRLILTPWTVARQAPLFMGFSRQEYRSVLPFPPPGDLPDIGMESVAPASPALQVYSLTAEPPWKPLNPHTRPHCSYFRDGKTVAQRILWLSWGGTALGTKGAGTLPIPLPHLRMLDEETEVPLPEPEAQWPGRADGVEVGRGLLCCEPVLFLLILEQGWGAGSLPIDRWSPWIGKACCREVWSCN